LLSQRRMKILLLLLDRCLQILDLAMLFEELLSNIAFAAS
jgi:hypothetical protein